MTMKKTLALMAGCALCVSAAMAAVQGNNTAVIVKKAVAESANGYQFLCLPVRGFDITGQGAVAGIMLNDALPPTTNGFGATTTLIVKSNEAGDAYLPSGTYVISDKAWAAKDGAIIDNVGEKLLANGAVFWLSDNGDPSSTNATQLTEDQKAALAEMGIVLTTATDAATPAELVFVGEKVDLAEGKPLIETVKEGMNAYCNATSESVTLSNVVANPADGDQLQRVVDGKKTYKVYAYVKDGDEGMWLDWDAIGTNLDATTVSIAPGEAFYYYRAASAN